MKSTGVVFGCDENQDTTLVSLQMRTVDDSYGELLGNFTVNNKQNNLANPEFF